MSARGSKFDQSEESIGWPIRAVLPECNARCSIKGTAPSFLRISFSDRYQQHVNLWANAVWSATKTRQYHPESRTRVPFRRGAIRGHYTVAPPITVPVDQSEQSSRHATREVSINNNNNIRYACTCLSPLRRIIPVLFRFAPAFGQPR